MAASTITPGTWERLEAKSIVGYPAPAEEASHDYEQKRKEDLFLQDARERFTVSENAERNRRLESLDDLRFRAGFQWRETDRITREGQGRPCLTINRIPGFVSHVVNNMRQGRPEIKIDPVADGADEEIAEIRQGIIRHIEITSRAEIAYDTSFESMCTGGLGYMRVVDAWSDDRSFDKDLRIEWVPNSFSIYEDPAAMKPDWSDGKYRFVVEDISLSEFRRRFGREKAPVSLSEFKSIGDESPYWLLGDKIRIAEYFHIEEEDAVLCELSDGTTAYDSELTTDQLENEVVQMRPAKIAKVMWTLMYGLGILKQRVWPGKYIPIIPVIGNQIELEGERILVGMVRYAKEAQRMFNYMYSSFVEACALAPRAPFVAEFDQISEFLDIWKTANSKPVAVLPYRMKTADGVQAPPPRREQAEPPIQAFVEGLRLADENLKSVFRIFDASLGQRGPQESGLAINSRKVESDLATYDWIDNFGRGLRFLGMVLNDLLPHYYNRPGRIVQILQEDLTRKATTINQAHDVDGQEKFYDLSKGRFAITISVGPGFATKRQEFVKSAVEVAKYYPQLWQVCGPMIIKGMDWPGADAMAAQLEKAMPPELRTPDPNAPQVDPQQMQQQSAQMAQQIQMLSKLLGEATDAHRLQDSKEEWETMRTQLVQQTNLAIAEMKVGSDEAKLMAEKTFAEFERIRMALEGQTIDAAGKPSEPKSSAAPQSAEAPQSAPPSSPPSGGGETPAEVGIGTQTQ